MVERVGTPELLARLEALPRPGMLAFDADGTLWRGDVGEDVFVRALSTGFLRDEITKPLSTVARDAGLDGAGSAAELCLRLFEAYRDGTFDERKVCEVMTWCYAGRSAAEVTEFARSTLHDSAGDRQPLAERYNASLVEVLRFARDRGCRCVIISASPQMILEAAAQPLGFGPEDIIGARAAVSGDRLLPRMDGEVPYGPDKARLGAPLAASDTWLASFGDSPFDIDLLRAARVAVGVAPKPALLQALSDVPGACVLVSE